MTEDHYKSLIAMLLDTLAAQQGQINALKEDVSDRTSTEKSDA